MDNGGRRIAVDGRSEVLLFMARFMSMVWFVWLIPITVSITMVLMMFMMRHMVVRFSMMSHLVPVGLMLMVLL